MTINNELFLALYLTAAVSSAAWSGSAINRTEDGRVLPIVKYHLGIIISVVSFYWAIEKAVQIFTGR